MLLTKDIAIDVNRDYGVESSFFSLACVYAIGPEVRTTEVNGVD